MSCAQIGSEAPYKCYETNIAEDCCETCTRIQRTDNSGKQKMMYNYKAELTGILSRSYT